MNNDYKQNCICCSSKTIDSNRFDVKTNCSHFQKTIIGLRCKNCNALLCANCILAIHEAIVDINYDVHLEYTNYVESLKRFVSTKNYYPSNDFVGHCCIITRLRKSEREKNIQRTNHMKRKNIEKSSFGGSFCLPEYNLLIGTSTTCMDVFGLGKDDNLEPTLHFVLDEECASELSSEGVSPQLFRPTSWSKYERTFDIVLPHDFKNNSVKVSHFFNKLILVY